MLVQFHGAFDSDDERKRVDGSTKDALATRRGDPVDTDLKLVNKVFGVCRDQVAIRYLK